MTTGNVQLLFEAPKGQRLHRYFSGVTMKECGLWWNEKLHVWESLRKHTDCSYSTRAPCRSVRAFKRMLRKHPHIRGKSILVNRYKGHNVYG